MINPLNNLDAIQKLNGVDIDQSQLVLVVICTLYVDCDSTIFDNALVSVRSTTSEFILAGGGSN